MLRAVSIFAAEFQRAALTLIIVILLGAEGIFFVTGIASAYLCGALVGACRYLVGIIMEDMEL